MICVVEMFGRVLIFRAVAAADVSANKTHAQTHPAVAGLDAVFAHRDVSGVHVLYLVFMMTFSISHLCILSYFLTVWAWGDSPITFVNED